MNYIDYIVIAIYLLGIVLLGRAFKNNDKKDYFLGGRQFGWFPLSMSIVATQLSAISFISAPAFVGLKQGGGMVWLTYEFAVPLAMIFLMIFIVPPMYKAGIVSVYSFLENRFGGSTRQLLSAVFQLSRAFATGVMIYTVALILTSVLDIAMWQTILMIGIITVIYSYQGGIKAVIYADLIQMIILFFGILVCFFFGLYYLGGWDEFLLKMDRDRLNVVNFESWGFSQNEGFGFFPMLLGGFFLYASYYGTDQSQIQRVFSASNISTVRKTLFFNGVIRFPITLIYCIMGLVIGTLAFSQPNFLNSIPSDKPDLLIPIFIRDYLPNGVIGVLIIAIFSAAMSSLSSVINSLSAATVEDFFNRKKKLPQKKYMSYSKYASIFWGGVCIFLAFFTGDIAKTVIEAINKVGSVFYGPILATFIMAILVKRINSVGVNVGLVIGVLVNVYLWLFVPQIFWFWWNVFGAIITFTVAYIVSTIFKTSHEQKKVNLDLDFKVDWKKTIILGLFFILIVLLSINLPNFF